MDKQTMILSELLKQKRESQGYSLRQLSSVVGVSFSTLARIERGDGEPDNNTKIRILEWLGDDARRAGLKFDSVALVHFRARKQIDSETVQGLLRVADYLKGKYGSNSVHAVNEQSGHEQDLDAAISLSKDEMEEMAELFRQELGLSENERLDAFRLQIEGVKVLSLEEVTDIDSQLKSQLLNFGRQSWSAMSVPLEENTDRWAIVWNSSQSTRRQSVSLLEEIWHILLGHKLTRITKVADVYGRTFAEAEEHDAYYVAAATLLPAGVIKKLVEQRGDVSEIAAKYGTTPELVEYRIKRLGLWRQYKGMKIILKPEK
ncbi:ImmA/IrrE family metallo-endopeptidase [Funiculus sociatus GB2-A5]|uniref:ImmA/IrrE family metallo-endopeptidase n=2 Tax=Cyanophyceae TaxID=3028117 RepID=A0ABV0JXC6_9CYAN|nr:ImmA/IrrE family metallo-endopeptidase [Trichocoleus sp. FACHB-6]MBD1905924.1 ImmA/IrrE family metallo-endopeptidase [Trichocoleus sp. FACHB-832]MBD2061177.1 ImmA/IrrE family metallo-endopeptidase [Trichocoleus sp. FACHB-6]